MEQISVLVVTDDIEKFDFDLPDYLKIILWNDKLADTKEYCAILVLDKNISNTQFDVLSRIIRAYTVFCLDTFDVDALTKRFVELKIGQALPFLELEIFLKNCAKNYYLEEYGEKFTPGNVGIAQGFMGSVQWLGQYEVCIEGDYGQSFNQIAFWRNNIPVEPGQAIDIWLEYIHDNTVEIQLKVRKIISGSVADISNEWVFSEEDMKQEVTLDNDDVPGSFFFSISAKGHGKLEIIALHDRHSRRGLGCFMVGGKRHVTSAREEIFTYFDPGDMKPPLAVYFSGYKTKQGFEGYHMMRKLGCPFLLVSEQRFEGGGFYMGSDEYEGLMVDIIKGYLKQLKFYPEQLILSGISMGSIASMFYGCDLRPHALILGKPLASLGDIAENERLNRPGGFATSLDLLHHFGHSMDRVGIESLNNKFWNKIRKTNFSHTKFIVSYMIEDDYDRTAYDRLLSELNSDGVQVYGKGLHGRHNDNSAGISAWFKGQYDKIMREDFGRK